jgi:hypothetical protein
MIDWIKTAHGVAAIVAGIFATIVAWWNLGLLRLAFSPEAARGTVHHGIEALEQFNRDTRLLLLDQDLVAAHRLGMLWPEMDAPLLGDSCGEVGRRPGIIIAAGWGCAEGDRSAKS